MAWRANQIGEGGDPLRPLVFLDVVRGELVQARDEATPRPCVGVLATEGRGMAERAEVGGASPGNAAIDGLHHLTPGGKGMKQTTDVCHWHPCHAVPRQAAPCAPKGNPTVGAAGETGKGSGVTGPRPS